MGTNSEARKSLLERTVVPRRWTAVLAFDGEPVAGPVPCSDYDAASILAPLVVGWLGGPVSVGSAVVAARPVAVPPQGSLFEGAS